MLIEKWPYPDNLADRYHALSDLPGFALLESSDKRSGRFDIVSAYPYETICIERNAANLEEGLRQIAAVRRPNSTSSLPFQGGAIGYISYDWGALKMGLSVRPHPDLAHLPLLAYGLYDWGLVVDHLQKIIYCVQQQRHNSTPSVVKEIQARWEMPRRKIETAVIEEPLTPLWSASHYHDAFHGAYEALVRGQCYQVNLTQPFRARYRGQPYAIYEAIKAVNPVPFGAYLNGLDHAILSFSPERFLQMENRHIFASPIKGTSKRYADPALDRASAEALLHSVKNRAENVMIVDLWRNDFGRLAVPGSVRVPELCTLEHYADVHHLVSHIEAICRPTISFEDVISACFPAGSITGAPKRESMRVINALEPYARGVYCGSIGYVSTHGRVDSNIAIRTMTATQNTLHMGAGGGVVIDSTVDEEYQECFLKLAAIMRGLNKLKG